MQTLRFSGIIRIIGVNPYVSVSAARAKILKPGWRKPMPVLVRINGQPEMPWRINMMPKGNGSFYLYLHGNVRKASKTKVGDRVEVELSFDHEYKSGPLPMPDWLEKPLKKNSIAFRSWEVLSPSRKKEIIRYLLNLKSTESRRRNIIKIIHALSGEKMQFMGRSWKDGK